MKTYTFSGMTVPEDTIASIDRYVEHGIPTGGFLEAVICNDLRGAVSLADEYNIRVIPAIVAYFYNETPMGCWGRPESFDDWIEKHRAFREQSA